MTILELDTMKRPGARIHAKRKGARGEYKTRRRLESAGYTVIKAGGSLGCFDLIALGAVDIRAVQVKVNGYVGKVERAAMLAVVLPPNAQREIWRWIDHQREPLIELL